MGPASKIYDYFIGFCLSESSELKLMAGSHLASARLQCVFLTQAKNAVTVMCPVLQELC